MGETLDFPLLMMMYYKLETALGASFFELVHEMHTISRLFLYNPRTLFTWKIKQAHAHLIFLLPPTGEANSFFANALPVNLAIENYGYGREQISAGYCQLRAPPNRKYIIRSRLDLRTAILVTVMADTIRKFCMYVQLSPTGKGAQNYVFIWKEVTGLGAGLWIMFAQFKYSKVWITGVLSKRLASVYIRAVIIKVYVRLVGWKMRK